VLPSADTAPSASVAEQGLVADQSLDTADQHQLQLQVEQLSVDHRTLQQRQEHSHSVSASGDGTMRFQLTSVSSSNASLPVPHTSPTSTDHLAKAPSDRKPSSSSSMAATAAHVPAASSTVPALSDQPWLPIAPPVFTAATNAPRKPSARAVLGSESSVAAVAARHRNMTGIGTLPVIATPVAVCADIIHSDGVTTAVADRAVDSKSDHKVGSRKPVRHITTSAALDSPVPSRHGTAAAAAAAAAGGGGGGAAALAPAPAAARSKVHHPRLDAIRFCADSFSPETPLVC